MSVASGNKYLFFGHKSGLVSIWEGMDKSPYLNNIKTFKIHYDGINKMICEVKKEGEKEKYILTTCSSDKTLKVHSLEDSHRICIN